MFVFDQVDDSIRMTRFRGTGRGRHAALQEGAVHEEGGQRDPDPVTLTIGIIVFLLLVTPSSDDTGLPAFVIWDWEEVMLDAHPESSDETDEDDDWDDIVSFIACDNNNKERGERGENGIKVENNRCMNHIFSFSLT